MTSTIGAVSITIECDGRQGGTSPLAFSLQICHCGHIPNKSLQMQLTAQHANMVVDFYPVKYADGSISERLMYKTVTFMNDMQSKSYINKESFEKEVDNRVYGYNYEVTDMHTEPQLFNSALIQTRW
jgi:hypothetical protein